MEVLFVRILFIEDDQRIVDFVCQGFTEAGFVLVPAYNGLEGLELALQETFDVIIIDIMLPGADGLEIVQKLRAQRVNTPILILSAKRSVDDRVAGIQNGADDYLTKPFAFAELLVRVQALLRRGRGSKEPNQLRVEGIVLDLLSRRVFRAEREIQLLPKEFALLEYLMRNAGHVLTRTQILEHVWGYSFQSYTNVVDVHVCRLREKLAGKEGSRLIRTVRGAGYMFSDNA